MAKPNQMGSTMSNQVGSIPAPFDNASTSSIYEIPAQHYERTR
jgi:hypothetical protein